MSTETALSTDELAERATALDWSLRRETDPRILPNNWFFLYETLPPSQARLVAAYSRFAPMGVLEAFGEKGHRAIVDRLTAAMHRIYLKGCEDAKWRFWAMEYYRRLRFILSLES
jgi:hypothetical protein